MFQAIGNRESRMRSWKLTASNESLVLDAGTLGQTGGSRGVHDAEDVLGLARVGIHRVVLAHLAQLLVGDKIDVRVVLFEVLDLAALGEHAIRVHNEGLDAGFLDSIGRRR